MSAATAAQHSPAELTFADACDLTNIVHFTAPSASTESKVNTVGLDVLTGEAFCSCRAAECGRACWHVAHVAAAWESTAAMREVSWLTSERLEAFGKKYRAFIDVYRARCGRALPADATNLVAARCEYRLRQLAAESAALAA